MKRPVCVLDGPADHTFVDAFWRAIDRAIPIVPLSQRLPVERREALRRFLEHHPPGDDVATIVFTSGSTAAPKGVQHSLAAHLHSAEGANENIPLRAGHRWLISLPLYHVGGIAILFRCRAAGAQAVLRDKSLSLRQQILRDGITHVSMVPTQLRRLLDEGPRPDSLETVLLGGDVLPRPLVARALAAGLPMHTTYGMTESASQVCTTPPGADMEDLETAGYVLRHRELRIEDGHIEIRGPVRFLGYLGQPRLPEEVWHRTGDLGDLDKAGRLHVLGRADNMFISGGENIHPEEIERAILRLPEVRRVVVVAMDDAEFGQVPVAYVETEEGVFDPAPHEKFLRELLPGFSFPKTWSPWPSSIRDGMKLSRDEFTKLHGRNEPNRQA